MHHFLLRCIIDGCGNQFNFRGGKIWLKFSIGTGCPRVCKRVQRGPEPGEMDNVSFMHDVECNSHQIIRGIDRDVGHVLLSLVHKISRVLDPKIIEVSPVNVVGFNIIIIQDVMDDMFNISQSDRHRQDQKAIKSVNQWVQWG